MRKVLLSIAAAVAMLASGSFVQHAEAVTLGAPAGMQTAADDLAVVDRVHCVPGWRHHYPTYWRYGNGCPRYGGGYVHPGRYWYGHRHHWHRRHIHIHRRHIHVHPRHVHIHRHHFHRHRR
jgi:hypothetical protein